MSDRVPFDGPPSPPFDCRLLVTGEFNRHGRPYCHMMDRVDPFMIDISDEEDVQDTPLPVSGDVMGGETNGNFGINLPAPCHSDIERLYELLGRGQSTMTGNDDIPPVAVDTAEPEAVYSSFYSQATMTGNGDIPPVAVDTAEPEDVYSSFYSQAPGAVFTSENTSLPVYVEDAVEVAPEYSAPVSYYHELGLAASGLGVAEVGDYYVTPPMSTDVAGFEQNTYHPEFAEMAYARAALALTDDDIIMADAPMVPPNTTSNDDPLPYWMMHLLDPSFLQELKEGCNLKEIAIENGKIRFSFA
ncbi:hypothetical protein F4680DRAFT_464586 [Xylaria scruposa]|nr:hypothetical protein F4680DRAFT_464586 [Xylaria scruposa]